MDGPCKMNNPVLVRKVAMVCCALHNICERHQSPFEPGWLPEEIAYVRTTPAKKVSIVIGLGSSVREALARHIHRHVTDQLHNKIPVNIQDSEPFYLL